MPPQSPCGAGKSKAMERMQAQARAHPNIALVKYWGKRDAALNLPAVGSVSITLDSLWTDTRIAFDPALTQDEVTLNGAQSPAQTRRVSQTLDLMRAHLERPLHARVHSHNNFPTAAGLASSASGFAALVVAANAALDLKLPARELSILARRGSGSAARSIFGGFVDMHVGARADGSDAFAEPLQPPAHWPLEVVVAITASEAKKIGSTEGMNATADTSPYYPAWVRTAPQDIEHARAAINARDFGSLAQISEFSCLKMHGLAMSANPGLLYWNGASMACLHAIRTLRAQGHGVFFTVDAGPQIKAICLPGEAQAVGEALAAQPGVIEVLVSALGQGARLTARASCG